MGWNGMECVWGCEWVWVCHRPLFSFPTGHAPAAPAVPLASPSRFPTVPPPSVLLTAPTRPPPSASCSSPAHGCATLPPPPRPFPLASRCAPPPPRMRCYCAPRPLLSAPPPQACPYLNASLPPAPASRRPPRPIHPLDPSLRAAPCSASILLPISAP